IHDILILQEDNNIILEVYTSAGETSFYCFALANPEKISRGAIVINTHKSIEIPVGKEVLGRVMNLFGDPVDDKGPITTKEKKSIYNHYINFDNLAVKKEVIETGI